MMNDVKKLIGPRIRQLRLERGLSVMDLCEATGLSRNWVYVLERGDHEPSLETVARLADVLGCDENDLLTFPDSAIRHAVIDLTRHASLDVLQEMKRLLQGREALRKKRGRGQSPAATQGRRSA
jgi:transcriptional regulator with XRE-family HTH domain